jgi:formamidopyrimidine-DNA glycosylase
MPELPEVETIVRDIRPALLGRRIVRAALSHDDVLRGVSRRRLLQRLQGAAIRDVTRRAKHAVIVLDGLRLIVQPGMTGSLVVHKRPVTGEDAQYAVLRAQLDNGRELVYRDVRRLGTLLLLDDRQWARYSEAIGPEPMDQTFTAEQLGLALRRSRQAVKKVIMDQKALAGVGNIYANEALFRARIRPSAPAGGLSRARLAKLVDAVRFVLDAAIAKGGSTLRDYVGSDGAAGYFQLDYNVYGRAGEPCRVCAHRIRQSRIGQRSTFHCPHCQSR